MDAKIKSRTVLYNFQISYLTTRIHKFQKDFSLGWPIVRSESLECVFQQHFVLTAAIKVIQSNFPGGIQTQAALSCSRFLVRQSGRRILSLG